jgi:hypothetical protein
MREICDAEWDDIQDRLKEKDAELERLKALLARAADALDGATKLVRTESESDLIAELRKAATE